MMTSEHASPLTERPPLQVEHTDVEKESLVMWQVGKIKDMNREFDIAFWQAQDATARLRAGWELIKFYKLRRENHARHEYGRKPHSHHLPL